jgi:hypothetical protein
MTFKTCDSTLAEVTAGVHIDNYNFGAPKFPQSHYIYP